MTTDKTPATLDAVRNLIVCDTQFTWAGVTNLTMPQMMDLQARGWVVEGDSNDEFQLTEAGEAVVARALEHGAPATLATVKHGGCVQLRHHDLNTSEGGRRFIAEYFTRELHRHDFTNYITTRLAADFACALAQHLSAQPSPGGQGDARIPFETWAESHGFDVAKDRGIYNSLETRSAWEAWLHWQRLAARQPVCATVKDSLTVGGGQAVADGWSGWATQYPGKMPKLYGAHEIAEVNHHPDEGQRLIFLSEQPAQAVDLGPFRSLARSWIVEAGGTVADTKHACADELLALIDSQGAR